MNDNVSIEDAKRIFGINFVGADELSTMPEGFRFSLGDMIGIPFSLSELKAKKASHVLIYCPVEFEDRTPVSIFAIRQSIEKLKSNSPRFYNQDWYFNEDFYKQSIDRPHWLLLQKTVDDSTRGVAPEKLEAEHVLPHANELTLVFFAYFFATHGKKLWNHDYVWCTDRDNTGDQIYVGRYTDPDGINGDGFEIHRHLSIKKSYGALL